MTTPVQPKQRLDLALVERGLCPTRAKAQRTIMAGHVQVNRQAAAKPGLLVRATDRIDLLCADRYVSRGGLKLEHALNTFRLPVRGYSALDLGAATGGFTDCLLQAGADRVYAVDVGYGQFAWKLRQDPRVVVMERTNARYLTPASFPPPFAPVDLIVIDCSFISLRKILLPAVALLRPAGKIVALIKPQFEAGKADADKGRGVIADPAIHQRVLDELRHFVENQPGLRWQQATDSPLRGPAGNKEFLVLLEKTD
jgi:23S rRNA (cytidine1920-2'-O)/16S rRNA (cytidine1409-2'-O)-methyltransferase